MSLQLTMSLLRTKQSLDHLEWIKYITLWKLDHLYPIWVDGSTDHFITSRGNSRQCKANEVPERFLDKQNIIQIFLGLQKTVNQHIILLNILSDIQCLCQVWFALEDESPQSWLRHTQSVETPAMSLVMWTCQNNLGLNLCVVPPTSHVVAISEIGLVRSYKERSKARHH